MTTIYLKTTRQSSGTQTHPHIQSPQFSCENEVYSDKGRLLAT